MRWMAFQQVQCGKLRPEEGGKEEKTADETKGETTSKPFDEGRADEGRRQCTVSFMQVAVTPIGPSTACRKVILDHFELFSKCMPSRGTARQFEIYRRCCSLATLDSIVDALSKQWVCKPSSIPD